MDEDCAGPREAAPVGDWLSLADQRDDATHQKNKLIEPYFGLGIYVNAEILPLVVAFVCADYTGETADEKLINYFDLNIGAEITAIPNVIITVAYDARNLMSESLNDGEMVIDPQYGMIRAQCKFKYY